jgi:vacuolar-type H+-ATPase subunit F/Vma7
MRAVCLSDEDTVNLFRLVGIEGVVLKSEDPEQFKEQMENFLKEPLIGLVIISERFLLRNSAFINQIKTLKYPIVVEVPDISNPITDNYFEETIKKNIGMGI